MPLVTNLQTFATRVATEFKAIRVVTGALVNLTTTEKTSLVGAINEIKAASLNAGAQINDTTPGTGTVYSSSKTEAHVAERIAALVAGSPALLDTLDEIAAALGDDPAFATTMTTALGNRVRYDAAQTLTGPQQVQARANIGAGTSNLALGTTNTTAKAGDYTPADATTGAKGLVQLAGMLGGTAASPTVRTGSETQTGALELATAAETTTGTSTALAVHPAGLKVELDKKVNTADVGNTETDFVATFNAGLV